MIRNYAVFISGCAAFKVETNPLWGGLDPNAMCDTYTAQQRAQFLVENQGMKMDAAIAKIKDDVLRGALHCNSVSARAAIQPTAAGPADLEQKIQQWYTKNIGQIVLRVCFFLVILHCIFICFQFLGSRSLLLIWNIGLRALETMPGLRILRIIYFFCRRINVNYGNLIKILAVVLMRTSTWGIF